MTQTHARKRIQRGSIAVSLAAAGVGLFGGSSAWGQSSNNRLLGLDISAWQGNITPANWNTLKTTDSRSFVMIRSSRGGTTGFYNQNNSSNTNPAGENTLSQRYDDPYFVQNITNATNAGLYAGTYHFGRMDIIANTPYAGGVANTGTDEANHFIQQAGAWMRPGYLLPVFDFEAGSGIRTASELATFAIDFSNQIYAAKGIRPAVYIGGNYAQPMDAMPGVVSAFPTLWTARWPNQANPNAIAVQTANPGDSASTVYGPWDNSPNPTHPWTFWQYASTAKLQGISNGTANVDVDVVHGGIEYLKDSLVPAILLSDNSTTWSTLANWNSGEAPVAPVQGPGQVARVGPLTLPATRLPSVDDIVILDRGAANPVITLDAGSHTIRKLYAREQLNITGGSLTVNYVPSADSTPNSAQFSSNVTLSATGAFSAHTTQVDAGKTFTLTGGSFTLNTINLVKGATPAKIVMGGDATFSPLSGATANVNSTGSGTTGSVDLNGGAPKFIVNDGAASVDLAVNVPITNGTLYKDGPGTMQLGAANTLTGSVTVNRGILLVTGSGQLGTTGVVTNMTVVTAGSGGSGFGGSLQLSNNVSYNLPIALGGAGQTGVSLSTPGSVGALDSLSGTNTWSGAITLNGSAGSGSDPLENQIGARAGTLVLSGVIQNGAPAASWVKTGSGDVVLTGPSANTYTGLTRLFGGRLIIEKNEALGGAGSTSVAGGNFFQNANSGSTLAFRAPGASAGFNYSTFEVLNTEGAGSAGFGQIDNLSGANSFAGQIAFGGPTLSGVIQSTIGVTAGSLDVQGGLYARGTTGQRNITKLGVGTLIVSGSGAAATPNPSVVPLSGSTFNISAGTVDLRGAASTNVLPGVTTWNVSSGAILKSSTGDVASPDVNVAAGGALLYSGGKMSLAALNLAGGNATISAGGSKVLRVNTLAISGGGKADLTNNDLVVDYTGASTAGTWNGSAYTGVAGLVAAGRNSGTWDGSGIVTSAATGTVTTLGVAEASDVFGISGSQTALWNGQSVDATSALVMYTYGGDSNLDGTIDVDDYTRIDFNAPLGTTGYFNGDFNYDGKINVDDYTIIDFNVRVQGAPLNSAAGLSGVTAIPEPASVSGAVVMLAVGIARRQRRSQANRI